MMYKIVLDLDMLGLLSAGLTGKVADILVQPHGFFPIQLVTQSL